MSYVDLNPVRAKMAETPEASDFTSIQQRIRELAPKPTKPIDKAPITPIPLMKLVSQHQDPHPNSIGFTLSDYLELIDWAGREIRDGKRGYINEAAPPILERLNLDPYRLMDHLRGEAIIEKQVMLGSVEKLKQAVVSADRKFVKGITEARRLFRPPLYT